MMKKQSTLLLAAIIFMGLSSQAAVRNEWGFEGDAAGTTLNSALNSGADGKTFAPGGAGILEANGEGALDSLPTAAGLWTDGATVDAPVTAASTGTRYMRYDLQYDLSSESNTVGTTIGISFVDSTGTQVAGLVLAYGLIDSTPPPVGTALTPVATNLNLTGVISAIAKVDLASDLITVWYDLTGRDAFIEGTPATSAIHSLISINDLRVRATGEASPSGTDDFVEVENIRTADSWAEISGPLSIPLVPAEYINHWAFEADSAGITLSDATNTGTDGAPFSPDDKLVTQTDGEGGLICSSSAAGPGELWTVGAILTADVTNGVSPEVRFLRYDFDYDLTETNSNDSGTLLSLAFTDGTATNLAGVAFKYDTGIGSAAAPAGITETDLATNLAFSGSISVIAKVDLGNQTMKVWYDLSGDNSFNLEAPDGIVSNLNLTAIEELQFRATGDFIPAPSGESVVIDDIRTAATWSEIFALTTPPAAEIEYLSHEIGNETGDIIGKIEPGESFDLTVTSINSGGGLARSVTNLLIAAGPVSFPVITPASDIYTDISPGATASTIYRVTVPSTAPPGPIEFYVVNQTVEGVVTNTFSLDVIKIGTDVSTTNLTLFVGIGEVGSAAFTLFNNSGPAASFSITDDGALPVGSYSVITQSESMVSFIPAEYSPDTVFSWTGVGSDVMEIGFDFELYGTPRTLFSVHPNGAVLFASAEDDLAIVFPFFLDIPFDQATIRYRKEADRLVVSWGNETGQELQAWFHADGTIRYLYEFELWERGDGFVGLADDQDWDGFEDVQVINHIPGESGRDSLLLTPQDSWVSYSPSNGTVMGSGGSQDITLFADATALWIPQTNTFNVIVNWTGGGSDVVAVTVIVDEQTFQLDVPDPFAFSGPAGFISPPAYMTVSNSGNAAVNYLISDSGLQAAGYTAETVDHEWFYIPPASDFIIEATDLDTTPVEIGFPFVFFGTTYTSLVVGVDGTLLLGDKQVIVPFADGLSLDGNASVRALTDVGQTRFTVTWESMAQPGGGDDQTFQAVLYRNGQIRFNYKWLGGGWPEGDILLTDGLGTVLGTLSNDTTTIVEEVLISATTTVTKTIGNVTVEEKVVTIIGTNEVVTFTATANRKAIEFTPGQQRIITFSPESGTVLPGQTADIKLIGDARSLTGSGANDVDTDTLLTFTHEGGSSSSDVTFTATNSEEDAYPDPVMKPAMWGTENPSVSSQQNSDGSRALSWPSAKDGLSRTYVVWYTTSLSISWIPLATLDNVTSYIDTEHNKEPVVFYKVTVQ